MSMKAYVRIRDRLWTGEVHADALAQAVGEIGEAEVEGALDRNELEFGNAAIGQTKTLEIPCMTSESRGVYYLKGEGQLDVEYWRDRKS